MGPVEKGREWWGFQHSRSWGSLRASPRSWFQVPAGMIIPPLLLKRGQCRGDASMAKPPRREKLNSQVRAFIQPASSTKCGSFPQHPSFLSARCPPGRGTATLELSSQFLPARVRPAKPAKTRPGAPRPGGGGGGGDGWGWHPAWLRSSGSVSRKDKCLYPPHSLPPRREAPAQTESPQGPVHPGVTPKEIAGQTGLQWPRAGGPCAPG